MSNTFIEGMLAAIFALMATNLIVTGIALWKTAPRIKNLEDGMAEIKKQIVVDRAKGNNNHEDVLLLKNTHTALLPQCLNMFNKISDEIAQVRVDGASMMAEIKAIAKNQKA
jgi:hypothetical protein